MLQISHEIRSSLKQQTSCPNSDKGAISSEDIDHYGFSWLPSLEDSTEERPILYNEILQHDAIFYNPNNIALMAKAYDIDQYDTFTLKHAAGDWNYKTMAKARDINISAKMLENGIYRIRQNRHEEAIAILNDAINLHDSNVEAYVARGAAFANRGAFIKAIADFEKALALAPDHPHALEYLAQTKAKYDAMYNKSVPEHSAATPSAVSDDESQTGHKGKRKSKKSSKSSDRKHHKKKKHKKEHKHRSKNSNSSSDSGSEDSDALVHPILQRQKHKLWG